MKRRLSVLLVAVMLLTMICTACGSKEEVTPFMSETEAEELGAQIVETVNQYAVYLRLPFPSFRRMYTLHWWKSL